MAEHNQNTVLAKDSYHDASADNLVYASLSGRTKTITQRVLFPQHGSAVLYSWDINATEVGRRL